MADNRNLTDNKIIHNEINAAKKRMFWNELKTGLFYCLTIGLPVFTILILADIAFEFHYFIRTVFLLLLIVVLLYLFYTYIVTPFLKYFEIKKGYDKYSIAKQLISDSVVQDKLLTYLELNDISSLNIYIEKAISQKETELSVTKFNKRIVFKNKKLIIRAGIVAFLFLFVTYLFTGQLFSIATKRLFNPSYMVSYKFLNYKFLNQSFEVLQNQDIDIYVTTHGTYVPAQVFIRIGDKDFYATRQDDTTWYYTFKNVNQSVQFYFHDNLNQSRIERLECIYYPVLKSINIDIVPPQYTLIPPSSTQNAGNFNFPAGSSIKWTIATNNTTHGYMLLDEDSVEIKISKNQFQYEKKLKTGFTYSLKLYNEKTGNKDVYLFYAKVIPDEYPEINVKLTPGEIVSAPILVEGKISDDYGFTQLNMVLIDINTDEKHTFPIPFAKQTRIQGFYYQMHLYEICQNMNIESCRYYFAVTDNDNVNGNKTTKTSDYEFNVPSEKDIREKTEQATENIKEKLQFGIEMMKYLNKQNADLQKRLKTEKLNQWEKDQIQNEISQGKAEMNKLLNEINDLNEKVKQLSKLEKIDNSKIAEKQREIEELLNKLMDDEILKMLQELEKLKSELTPQNRNEDKQLSMQDLEKMLERNLETLKRFQVEKKINEISEQLKDLSEKLEDAASTEERENIENQISENFDKHDKTLEENKELQKPLNLENFDKEKNEISDDMKSNDQKPNNKEDNKKTGKKLSELAQQMQQNLDNNFSEQEAEDLENLKQIRSNLLLISFIQEDLVDSMTNISNKIPEYGRLLLRQKTTIDYWNFAKDSLNQLMTRNPQLANIVSKDMMELGSVNETILSRLFEERVKPMTIQQMKALTHYNNILLHIDEAIQQSEEQSGSMGGGCPKPGKKKSSMSDMAKGQEGLKQQLQKMIKQMKDAQSKGQDGSGGQDGDNPQFSEQLGKYLSQQEQMQKMLNEMMNNGDMGSGAKELLKEINKLMDQNINDIVNKTLSNQTLLRQEQIITKLLESEKAEQERKTEEKRESRENRLELFSQPKDYKEDIIKSENFHQNFQYKLLNLKKYYLDLYQNYLNKKQGEND